MSPLQAPSPRTELILAARRARRARGGAAAGGADQVNGDSRGRGAEPAAASCDLVGTEGPALGSAVHCLPNQLEPRRRGVRHGPLLFAVPPLLKTLLWTLSVLDFC